MRQYNLCILGFGNVGRALVRQLQAKQAELREKYAIEWRITGVATRRMGWIADPDGLDPDALLAGQMPAQQSTISDVREWLEAAREDVLFELTSTDPHSGQPAREHVRTALERGSYVITANKGAVVHGYQDLQALAEANGTKFLFDAAVMAGAPVFSLFRDALPAVNILRFRGLLNATSNVILEEMEQGKSYDEAVSTAQALGIAETDPSLDVDGWDAMLKLCAISTVLLDVPLQPQDVQRTGIRGLLSEQVQAARAAGHPYKLAATLERTENGVVARVQPEQIALGDPLAAASDAFMLLAHFEMDMIPGLTMILHVPGEGTAGPDVTAYDVLADFLRAVRA
ncbi:MAG TPA: hypothetical protein VHZ51_22060 [Ktedonobacteraceae bacterium]|jgi:homoserine dehydrogenase|nr:hypothetical protein [Ktedonobacteraceae bacterium]